MSLETVLLGTAQDGGFPQLDCDCDNCLAAKAGRLAPQPVTALGLIDREVRRSWIIDATPDFPAQLRLLREWAPECDFSGILLTHAHIGHYTGLMYLGREGRGASRFPVYCSESMARFLADNAPWAALLTQQHIALAEFRSGVPVDLDAGFRITPHRVPHRGEYTDTHAFFIETSQRRVFYCPDIDDWDRLDVSLDDYLGEGDLALLDGTFFSEDELPHRDRSEIPHPLARDTVQRFAGAAFERVLIHLNHSNPIHGEGAALEWVRQHGASVGVTGSSWRLDWRSIDDPSRD
jgi:pyrroloquinoline quinone biosynthesis protein B